MIRTFRTRTLIALLSAVATSVLLGQQATAVSTPPSTTVLGQQGEAVPVGELNPSSFGVSPSDITVSNAARNGVFANDIGIFNSSSETQVFQVSATGAVASWTRFGPKESPVREYEFGVGPGRSSVRVQLDVPGDIANGTYKGAVLLSASPTPGSANGVSVTFEVGLSVVIDGEQIIKASYSNLSINSSEVGLATEIRATVANTGNVALPVSAVAQIKRGEVVVETITTDSTQTLLPSSSGDILLNWDTKDALPGDYSVSVDIVAGDLKLGSKQQTFRLEAPGKLTRSLKVEELNVVQEPDARPLLSGTVSNTGQISGRALVSARIVQRGKTVSVVQGDSFYVAPGQKVAFAVNLPLLTGGTYTAEVSAELDDYRSPPTTASFKVASESTTPPIVPIAAGVGVVGLLALGAKRRGSRSRRTQRTLRQEAASKPVVPEISIDPELLHYETL
jgi:hypothetical protein